MPVLEKKKKLSYKGKRANWTEEQLEQHRANNRRSRKRVKELNIVSPEELAEVVMRMAVIAQALNKAIAKLRNDRKSLAYISEFQLSQLLEKQADFLESGANISRHKQLDVLLLRLELNLDVPIREKI